MDAVVGRSYLSVIGFMAVETTTTRAAVTMVVPLATSRVVQ